MFYQTAEQSILTFKMTAILFEISLKINAFFLYSNCQSKCLYDEL